MCYVVSVTILGEEEGRDVGSCGVVAGCGVILEEVEDREGHEEEWGAPKRVLVVEQEACEEEGDAKSLAKEKGAQRDSGEGFRAVGEEGGIERGGSVGGEAGGVAVTYSVTVRNLLTVRVRC